MILKLKKAKNDEIVENAIAMNLQQFDQADDKPDPFGSFPNPLERVKQRIANQFDVFPIMRPRRSSHSELLSPTNRQQKLELLQKQEEDGESGLSKAADTNKKRASSMYKKQTSILQTKFLLDLNSPADQQLLMKVLNQSNKTQIMLSMLRRSLAQMEIFRQIESSLNPKQYDDMLSQLKPQFIKQGSTIFSVNSVGKQYYFIVKGAVYIYIKASLGQKMLGIEEQESKKQQKEEANKKKTILKSQQTLDSTNSISQSGFAKEIKAQKSLFKHSAAREKRQEDSFIASMIETRYRQNTNTLTRGNAGNDDDDAGSQNGSDKISIQWSEDSVRNVDMIREKYPNLQIVSTKCAGKGFGELSLLKGIKRTASVVAKEDCMVLKLDKDNFLHYLGDYFERIHRQQIEFVRQFSVFEQLEKRLSTLIILFEPATFINGQIIYSIGQPADYLYLIKKGTVGISKCKDESQNDQSSQQSDTISVNDISFSPEKGKFYVKESAAESSLMRKSCSPTRSHGEKLRTEKELQQLAVIADNGYFGDAEIASEKELRIQEARALSLTVEVLKISFKNLRIFSKHNDVIERLREYYQLKDTWRNVYTARSECALQAQKNFMENSKKNSIDRENCQNKELINDINTSILNRGPVFKRSPTTNIEDIANTTTTATGLTKTARSIEKTRREAMREIQRKNATIDISCRDSPERQQDSSTYHKTNAIVHQQTQKSQVALQKSYIQMNLQQHQIDETNKLKTNQTILVCSVPPARQSQQISQWTQYSQYSKVSRNFQSVKRKKTASILWQNRSASIQPEATARTSMTARESSKDAQRKIEANEEAQKEKNYICPRQNLDYRQIHSIFMRIEAERKKKPSYNVAQDVNGNNNTSFSPKRTIPAYSAGYQRNSNSSFRANKSQTSLAAKTHSVSLHLEESSAKKFNLRAYLQKQLQEESKLPQSGIKKRVENDETSQNNNSSHSKSCFVSQDPVELSSSLTAKQDSKVLSSSERKQQEHAESLHDTSDDRYDNSKSIEHIVKRLHATEQQYKSANKGISNSFLKSIKLSSRQQLPKASLTFNNPLTTFDKSVLEKRTHQANIIMAESAEKSAKKNNLNSNTFVSPNSEKETTAPSSYREPYLLGNYALNQHYGNYNNQRRKSGLGSGRKDFKGQQYLRHAAGSDIDSVKEQA